MSLKRSIFSTTPLDQGLLVQFNGTGVYNPRPPKIPKHGEPVRFPRTSSHHTNFKPGLHHDTTSKIPTPTSIPTPSPAPGPAPGPSPTPVPKPTPVPTPGPSPTPAPKPTPVPAPGPSPTPPGIPPGPGPAEQSPDIDIFEDNRTGKLPAKLPTTTTTTETTETETGHVDKPDDRTILERVDSIIDQISLFIAATKAVDWMLLNIGGKDDRFGVQAVYKAYKAKGLKFLQQFEDKLPRNQYLKLFNEFDEFEPQVHINDDLAKTMTRVGNQMETALDTADEIGRVVGVPAVVQSTITKLKEKLRKGLQSLKNTPTIQTQYVRLIESAEDLAVLEAFGVDYDTGAQQIVDDFNRLEESMNKVKDSVDKTMAELEANGTLKDASKIEEVIVLEPTRVPDLDSGKLDIETDKIPTDPDYEPQTTKNIPTEDGPSNIPTEEGPSNIPAEDGPSGRTSTTTLVELQDDLDEIIEHLDDSPEHQRLRPRTNSIQTIINDGDQNLLSLDEVNAEVKVEVDLLKGDIEKIPAEKLGKLKALKTAFFKSKFFKVAMKSIQFIGIAADVAQVVLTATQTVDLIVENEEKRIRTLYPDDYEGTPADIYNKDSETFINLKNMISRVSTAFWEGSSFGNFLNVEPYVQTLAPLITQNFHSPQPVPKTVYKTDGRGGRQVHRPSETEVIPRRAFNDSLAVYLFDSQEALRSLFTYLSENTKEPVRANVVSALRTFPNITHEQFLIKATGIPELWTSQFRFILGHVENPNSTNIDGLITQDGGSNIAGGIDYSGLWHIGLDIIGLGETGDAFEEAHRYMQPEYYPFSASSIWVHDNIVYRNMQISAGVLLEALHNFAPTTFLPNPILSPIKTQMHAVQNMSYDVPEKRFFSPSDNDLSVTFETQNFQVNKDISKFLLTNVEAPIITLAAYILNKTQNVQLRTVLQQLIDTPRVPDWIVLTTDTMLKSRIQNWGSLFNYLASVLTQLKSGVITDTSGVDPPTPETTGGRPTNQNTGGGTITKRQGEIREDTPTVTTTNTNATTYETPTGTGFGGAFGVIS